MTRTLTEVEQTAHLLLAPAPSLILKGQGETRRLSDRLQKLRRLLQQTLSVYSIVMLGYRVWQRRSQRI